MNDDMQMKLGKMANTYVKQSKRDYPFEDHRAARADFLAGANAAIELCSVEAAAREAVLVEALKDAQSKLCENCPQYMDSASEQVGYHTDECLAAMDAIEMIGKQRESK